LAAHDVLDPVCSRLECRCRFFLDLRQREIAPRLKAEQERKAHNREAAEKAARQLIAERPNSASIPLAVIPYWEPRLTHLAEGRRRAFRDRLMQMLSEATANRELTPDDYEEPPTTPEVQSFLGRVCAFCQGSCCQSGGNHAYITPDTLRRYMAANPHLRPREVLENYLDRLANRTNQNSCIYHGPQGCFLPRDMRSDTCNRWFCIGANRLRNEIGAEAPAETVLAREADGELRSAAMIVNGETRLMALTKGGESGNGPRRS
jgi:hypothetical protein